MREFDYDYGLIPRLLTRLGLRASKNLKTYGSIEAPLLDAKNIKVDLKMYYADGDVLVPSKVSTNQDSKPISITRRAEFLCNCEVSHLFEFVCLLTPSMSPLSQETFKLSKDLNVPDSNLHRIPDGRFSHFNFVLRSWPHALDKHSLDFFRGIESEWNPETSDSE